MKRRLARLSCSGGRVAVGPALDRWRVGGRSGRSRCPGNGRRHRDDGRFCLGLCGGLDRVVCEGFELPLERRSPLALLFASCPLLLKGVGKLRSPGLQVDQARLDLVPGSPLIGDFLARDRDFRLMLTPKFGDLGFMAILLLTKLIAGLVIPVHLSGHGWVAVFEVRSWVVRDLLFPRNRLGETRAGLDALHFDDGVAVGPRETRIGGQPDRSKAGIHLRDRRRRGGFVTEKPEKLGHVVVCGLPCPVYGTSKANLGPV